MSNFARAIEVVISTHEGGFQKRPDDPGNWTPNGELKGTKYGISAHSFPTTDIEMLTLTQAEDLYRQIWGAFCLLADQRVLTKVLDLAVNMQWGGHGHATEILQSAVNVCGGICNVDGVFGPKTADVANALAPNVLLAAICSEAEKRYARIEVAKPEMKAWFANWNHRAAWMPPEIEQEKENV